MENAHPEVSIVIPNFNHARYLEQRIESALSQSFKDIELIILDDHSTDNSLEIISRYKEHPKVSNIIVNESNSGSTFKQWRKGFELARGRYIWIAESDDYCELSLLEELLIGFKQNNDAVIAFCGTIMFDDDDLILYKTKSDRLCEHIKGCEFISKRMRLGNGILNASAVLFKKDALSKVSDAFCNYKLSGDWVLWVELLRQGDVFVNGKMLNYCRKHGNDVTGKAVRSGVFFKEFLEVLYYFEKIGVSNRNSTQEALFKVIRDKSIATAVDDNIKCEYFEQYGLVLGRQYWRFLAKQYCNIVAKCVSKMRHEVFR